MFDDVLKYIALAGGVAGVVAGRMFGSKKTVRNALIGAAAPFVFAAARRNTIMNAAALQPQSTLQGR